MGRITEYKTNEKMKMSAQCEDYVYYYSRYNKVRTHGVLCSLYE